ncbi:MAG: hypothetical protein KF864_03055 [Phycisphaeraceae bacterium]|nr:hypothetical protein [Phycisphaeraceae bacterium]
MTPPPDTPQPTPPEPSGQSRPVAEPPGAAGGACETCGYCLDGLGPRKRCPECGTTFEHLRPRELVAVLGEEACRALSRAATRILWGLALATFAPPIVLILGAQAERYIGSVIFIADAGVLTYDIYSVLATAASIIGSLAVASGQYAASLRCAMATPGGSGPIDDSNTLVATLFLREVFFAFFVIGICYTSSYSRDLRGLMCCDQIVMTVLYLASNVQVLRIWESMARLTSNQPLRLEFRAARYGTIVGAIGMVFTQGLSVYFIYISIAMSAFSLRRAANAPAPHHPPASTP